MIVPMKKVFLVVSDKDREESLFKLRELGVVHVAQKKVSSPVLSGLLDRKLEIEKSLRILKTVEARIKPVKANTSYPKPKSDDLASYVLQLDEMRKIQQDEIILLSKEKKRIEEWGDFNLADIGVLNQNGIYFRFYELPLKSIASLPEDVNYFVIRKDKSRVRIIVVNGEIVNETPFLPFEYSLSELDKLLLKKPERLKEIENEFLCIGQHKNILEDELETLRLKIEFESAKVGMGTLEGEESEAIISWISGYVPFETVEVLKKASAENGWALGFDDPSPGDTPPTLMRNNAVARLIRPLFSFLGTIPGYREYDISFSYLVFFSIFFAMILGDAAYGFIVMIAAIALAFKSKAKTGSFSDISKLFFLLSLCTIVWGSINGAWFSIPTEKLPLFLQGLIIPPFNKTGPLVEFPSFLQHIFKLPAEIPVDELKTRWCVQFLCFTIAVIQLVWARVKRIIRLLPSLSAIAQGGWFFVMLGFYFLVLSMLLKVGFPPFASWFMGVGVGAVLIFGEQNGGNFFKNIGKSFTGLFSLFLKVVGCFADIISYIRLFAVGLAGSMIGEIFYQLAIPSDGLGIFGLAFIVKLIMAAVILVLGHCLNLALTALSIIVHGVRLNLLEYAGNHLDMEWPGYAYNPFSGKAKEK